MLKRVFKRVLLFVLIVLLISVALLAYSFWPATLDVNAYRSGDSFQTAAIADPSSLPEVTISAIKCGKIMSRQSFAYLGGSWSADYESQMAAILIRHPQATLLFDTGFGTNVDDHVQSMPRLIKALTTYSKETSAAGQLRENGIAPELINSIILSHSHWDHVSGAEDFPGVEILVSKAEEDFIGTLPPSELITRMRDRLKLRSFDYSGDAYENFDRSFDLFGDGSLVLVPLPGHTPGSTGLFVNLRSGKRFFFIGDLTWALEGVTLPAERPWVTRRLADRDEDEVRRSIVKVHQLLKRYPDLVVVPAHDRRVYDGMAVFPDSER